MLPAVDLSKWNRLNGYEKKVFAHHWIIKVNDLNNSSCEGYTSPEGAKLIRNINDYSKEASKVSWKLYLLKELFNSSGNLYQSNKMFRVLIGLSKQRKMAWRFKHILSINPVDKSQEKIASFCVRSFFDRLSYLEKSFIPAVSNSSDIEYYLAYLRENDRDIQMELEQFIGDRYFNETLEEASEKTKLYFDHVTSIIEAMREREDISAAIREAKAREDRIHEESVKSAKKYEETRRKEKREKTEAIVNSLSSRAQKRIAPLKRLHDNKVYICVAAYVPTLHGTVIQSGYVRTCGGRKSITSDPYCAVMYKTEEEAISAGEALKSQAHREVIYNVVPIFRG